MEHEAIVSAVNGGSDAVLDGGQVIQTFLDQQANDAVGVEDEVGSLGVLVADDAARYDLSSICKPGKNTTYDNRAINWGVWARTLTLSKPSSTDTVAVGFWLCATKSGPTD